MYANDKIRYHTQNNLQNIQIQQTTSEGKTSGATINQPMGLLVTLLVTRGTQFFLEIKP